MHAFIFNIKNLEKKVRKKVKKNSRMHFKVNGSFITHCIFTFYTLRFYFSLL